MRPSSRPAPASFEAKYTTPSDTPKRDHTFQALATAAALHSPVAVIVLPYAQKPKAYDVTGFNHEPRTLFTIGLDLFVRMKKLGQQVCGSSAPACSDCPLAGRCARRTGLGRPAASKAFVPFNSALDAPTVRLIPRGTAQRG